MTEKSKIALIVTIIATAEDEASRQDRAERREATYLAALREIREVAALKEIDLGKI